MSQIEQGQSLVARSTVQKEKLLTEDDASNPSLRPSAPRLRKLTGLILTTILSTVLLAGKAQNWTLPDSIYHRVNAERASIQIVVQILSTIFGALQVTAICTLINLATRLQLNRSTATLNGFRFWFNMCIPHVEWTLPFQFFTPLLCFVLVTYIPAALWAGAISPVNIITTQQGNVTIPQYRNISLIQEYPSEYNSSGPQERNVKGAFAYNVGINLEGPLLFSASTATTIDSSPRKHLKLDNTGFTYIGRSYGVGSSAGLGDNGITGNPLSTAYSFEEVGYDVVVDCIYNASAEFVLRPDGNGWLWAAKGNLPNSNRIPEFSVYPGRSTASIVAIGVAHNQTRGTKFLGITT